MEIKDEILMLKNNNKIIKFLLITSHFGIKNNERVDQLTRESLTLDGPNNTFDLPIGDTYAWLKNKSFLEWKSLWDFSSQHKGRYLHNIMPIIPITPWFEIIKTFRRLTVHINRLRNGHSVTSEYLYNFGLRDHPYCECDETAIGDVNHIYLSCKNNNAKINKFYQKIQEFINLPTNMKILLSYIPEDLIISKIVIQHIISIKKI